MSKNNPNPFEQIEPWQLDAYLDGVYDEQVEAYIAEHEEAAQHLAAIRDFDRKMVAALFRESCPDADSLLNYQWGLIDDEEGVLIAAHIAECAPCQKEAVALAEPVMVANASSVPQILKEKLNDLGESLRVFIGQYIPEEQLSVPAIRSATDPPETAPVTDEDFFYASFILQDITDDQYGFSRNHIYTIIPVSRLTAEDVLEDLYRIEVSDIAGDKPPLFEHLDWATTTDAICYIKKISVLAKESQTEPLKSLYHIEAVTETVLSTDEHTSYFTIVPVDALMLGQEEIAADYGVYRITKLTAVEQPSQSLPQPAELHIPLQPEMRELEDEVTNSPPAPAVAKQQLYSVGELGLDIALTLQHTSSGKFKLEGQILGTTNTAVNKVGLIRTNTILKTARLNQANTFLFKALEPATYTLCFYGNGIEICLPGIQVPVID